MKKLIIAAAIACAAAMSQAATVYWGGGLCNPECGDVIDAPATAVLVWSATAFDGVATEITGLTKGATTDNGGTVVDTVNITAALSAASVFSKGYEKENAGVDGYYAVLISNPAGDLATYYELDSISGTSAISAPTNRQINNDLMGEHWLTESGYTVAVAPEPTSGLLLLLGVAGLALRRRRA